MRLLKLVLTCTEAEVGPLLADLAEKTKNFDINVVDVLKEGESAKPVKGQKRGPGKSAANGATAWVRMKLSSGPKTLDEMMEKCKQPRASIASALYYLKKQEVVGRRGKNGHAKFYLRKGA